MDKKRGRPRNTEAKNAILNASYDLLLEMGFGAVTVEKIAEQAQVSKATIYKWWPNKAAVVMDGYLFAATARLPIPDSGSVKEDLLIHAGNLAMFLSSREGKVITELIGEGQFDAGLAEAYRSRYFGPRRQEAWQLLERGVARGELKQELDIGSSIDLIYGPIFYRLLLTGDALNEESVRNLVLLALEGIQA
ncbi:MULTISPECIES: TetR/AcrR family transcriptional regulator [Paenibacillus]|jgi:AcrR family transcriptional regulator|uniref:TetR/AcrR family transcriptional regulator n=1 Tax=Paenibacillus TaxID=44249 RepID=UPI0004F8F958|nr:MULTISPECIES: TetR/AcrR family transcriptional regulator [unclassified Paenibacillus]AIQ27909.1 TetR family transcriptional regulator [Paenibacillus sp. FSL P4-0081]OMF32803.1 TetR family transcriptional regulator [Paenibacillus sp. FSL H8-0259]